MLKFIKSNLFFFLLLTAVVFSLYGKSIFFDFSYRDDDALIVEKVQFLSDIKNIPKLFTTSCFYSSDFQYYRPLLNLSFLIETCIFGLSTKIYHLTNIILFILSLYLMYVFLLRLKLNETILKFLILLVAVHPVFVSAVVWIPARNDTLLAIFVFLSFIFFVDYLQYEKIKNLISYILFFTFALFTKETAIAAVFLYVLFIWCFGYKLNKKEIIKNILIFLPLLIVYFCLRTVAVSQNETLSYLINFNEYLKNAVSAAGIYFYEMLFPKHVPIMLRQITLNVYQISFLVFLLFFIIICLYKKIVSKKIFIWSFAWFLLFLFPTFVSDDYVFFNHRFVIPFLSVIMLVAIIINKFLEFEKTKKYLVILFVLMFCVYADLSFYQQDKYKNKYMYWTNTFSDAPTYHAAYYWISNFYLEQKNYSKAKEFINRANELKQNVYISCLALIYYYENNFDESEKLYKQSIDYGINKAQCYRNLSVIYLKRDNDINKAVEYAKLAVQQEPYDDGYKKYLRKLIDEKNNI